MLVYPSFISYLFLTPTALVIFLLYLIFFYLTILVYIFVYRVLRLSFHSVKRPCFLSSCFQLVKLNVLLVCLAILILFQAVKQPRFLSS